MIKILLSNIFCNIWWEETCKENRELSMHYQVPLSSDFFSNHKTCFIIKW